VRWHFTPAQARRKLRHFYPHLEESGCSPTSQAALGVVSRGAATYLTSPCHERTLAERWCQGADAPLLHAGPRAAGSSGCRGAPECIVPGARQAGREATTGCERYHAAARVQPKEPT
jgi:hypothetical protein